MEARVKRRNRSGAVVVIHVPKRLLASGRDDDDVQLQINIRDVDSGEEWVFLVDAAECVSFIVPIPLTQGKWFELNGRLLRRWSSPPPPLDLDQSALKPSGSVIPVGRDGYKTIDSAHAVFRAGK